MVWTISKHTNSLLKILPILVLLKIGIIAKFETIPKAPMTNWKKPSTQKEVCCMYSYVPSLKVLFVHIGIIESWKKDSMCIRLWLFVLFVVLGLGKAVKNSPRSSSNPAHASSSVHSLYMVGSCNAFKNSCSEVLYAWGLLKEIKHVDYWSLNGRMFL